MTHSSEHFPEEEITPGSPRQENEGDVQFDQSGTREKLQQALGKAKDVDLQRTLPLSDSRTNPSATPPQALALSEQQILNLFEEMRISEEDRITSDDEWREKYEASVQLLNQQLEEPLISSPPSAINMVFKQFEGALSSMEQSEEGRKARELDAEIQFLKKSLEEGTDDSPKQTFDDIVTLQKHHSKVEEVLNKRKEIAEEGLRNITYLSTLILESHRKCPSAAKALSITFNQNNPAEAEALAKKIWEAHHPKKEEGTEKNEKEEEQQRTQERKELIGTLRTFARKAKENSLEDFPEQELQSFHTFDEEQGVIVFRILRRLQKAEAGEETKLIRPLAKLLRAFLTAFKGDKKEEFCSLFSNTTTPTLIEMAIAITNPREESDTMTYRRIDVSLPEDNENIAQSIRIPVREARKLADEIKKSSELLPKNKEELYLVMFYSLELMKRVMLRVPKKEHSKERRRAIARANRATLPLKNISESVGELFLKATTAKKIGKNEIIVIPDSITTELSKLRSIAEDISFSPITNGENKEGGERDYAQTIDQIKLLGISDPFDQQVLETLKNLFVTTDERFPEHSSPRNISAEELVGFMLESSLDRENQTYQKWVLQTLIRAAGSMIPFQHPQEYVEKVFSQQTDTSAIHLEDTVLMQKLFEELEKVEKAAEREENIGRLSKDRATHFATGILACILLLSEKEREKIGFDKYFNEMVLATENYARKMDMLFDDSVVADYLRQMEENFGQVGKKSTEPTTEEDIDPEVAELFEDFDL